MGRSSPSIADRGIWANYGYGASRMRIIPSLLAFLAVLIQPSVHGQPSVRLLRPGTFLIEAPRILPTEQGGLRRAASGWSLIRVAPKFAAAQPICGDRATLISVDGSGDIDRDARVDVLFNFPVGYADDKYVLFLSSLHAGDQLISEAASFPTGVLAGGFACALRYSPPPEDARACGRIIPLNKLQSEGWLPVKLTNSEGARASNRQVRRLAAHRGS